jgi:hypothetical protein
MMKMLPGRARSSCEKSAMPPLEGRAELWPDDKRRGRGKYRLNKREADHHPGETRVRFEFARGAHQRESTPKLGINRVYRDVKEKEARSEENRAEWCRESEEI